MARAYALLLSAFVPLGVCVGVYYANMRVKVSFARQLWPCANASETTNLPASSLRGCIWLEYLKGILLHESCVTRL